MQLADIPVFVLCGSLGSRLKEMTEFRPKPMIPIGQEPILVHVMGTIHSKVVKLAGQPNFAALDPGHSMLKRARDKIVPRSVPPVRTETPARSHRGPLGQSHQAT